MAQFLRPAADITVGGWVTNTGATTNRFVAIDEIDGDDADFVTQAAGNVNDAYEVRLGAVTTPLVDRLHVVRYRYQKNQALGNVRNLQVTLVHGATIIATGPLHSDLSTVWREGAFALTTAQAAAITDYGNLRLRFAASGTTSGTTARRTVQVSWAQMRVPDWQPTFENQWGAAEDTSTPGIWRYTLNGITREGASQEGALFALTEALSQAANDATRPAWDRRYHHARARLELATYPAYRAQLAAGVGVPPHQTQAEALAIVDAKLATFTDIAAQLDAADRA